MEIIADLTFMKCTWTKLFVSVADPTVLSSCPLILLTCADGLCLQIHVTLIPGGIPLATGPCSTGTQGRPEVPGGWYPWPRPLPCSGLGWGALNRSCPQRQMLHTSLMGPFPSLSTFSFSSSASWGHFPSETPALKSLSQGPLLGKMSPGHLFLWDILTGHEIRESHFRKNCSRQLCSFCRWEDWGPEWGILCSRGHSLVRGSPVGPWVPSHRASMPLEAVLKSLMELPDPGMAHRGLGPSSTHLEDPLRGQKPTGISWCRRGTRGEEGHLTGWAWTLCTSSFSWAPRSLFSSSRMVGLVFPALTIEMKVFWVFPKEVPR